jgi:hypothetical protein
MRSLFVASILIAAMQTVPFSTGGTPHPTRADRSGFTETTRYDEVIAYIREIAARSARVRMESFGASEENRALPLVLIGDPPPAAPADVDRGARPIVLVMANIHAGEVEGKEAALRLVDRLATGDLVDLSRTLTVLVAPIYNADGNERISSDNRPEQNGPIGGVGTRGNARGLDLNRDFVKLESREARALAGLLRTWDPAVVIDLHTTNGSYHGYHLTWSPALNPNTDPRLTDFTRQVLLPAVTRRMKDRGWRLHPYGNIASASAPGEESEHVPGTSPVWRTFDSRPRFGNNYVGLRNRIAVLSEAYSYVSFARRIAATEDFVEELLRALSRERATVSRLIAAVDRDTQHAAEAGAFPPLGVAFQLSSTSQAPQAILVGDVEPKRNPRTGRDMTAMVEDSVRSVGMTELDAFRATRSVPLPSAYVVPADLVPQDVRNRVADVLRDHGVQVEILLSERRMPVEVLTLTEVTHAASAFQGHNTVSATGHAQRETVTIHPGSLKVSTTTPLARLVFQLLDPESDDGLLTWNYFDACLRAGAPAPIYRVLGE